MGTVFKKTATKPLPAGAKIIVRKGEQLAEWTDRKGKRKTAPLTTGRDGSPRIVITARTYTAKYRDGTGIVREVATGCRDESAARSILTDLEKRADKVRSGIRSVAEDSAIDHQGTPLADHFAAYLLSMESAGVCKMHRDNVRRALRRLAADCGFRRLGDLRREALEQWLVGREKAGMGARTRNTYRAAAVAFCNWCMETGRLLVNPLARVAKAAEDTDPRRQRRALTEDELRRLLDVAQRRPLAEYGRLTVRKPKDQTDGKAKRKRSTWTKLPLSAEDLDAATDRARQRLAKNPELVAAMESLGWERALIYKTLVLTGLRKGELASLAVGQLVLDADPAFLVLDAADEKNREGNSIPLRADLAADLRQWLADKAKAAQEATAGQVLRMPTAGLTLPADTPVFHVPRDLVRILNRDLAAAGIPKRDERGRTVDVHALRHCFGTLLSRAGVAPRTAQAAMRHSSLDLTMNTYTDPKLLDVAGAVESLPSLPLRPEDGQSTASALELSATGTEDSRASRFAPKFAPTTGKPCISGSILDKVTGRADESVEAGTAVVSACPVNRKSPLTTAVNGLRVERETGFEPATSSLGS